MKNKNKYFFLLAAAFAFAACSDDADPVIKNLTDAEGNLISFAMNAPDVTSYTLLADNANEIINTLTCEQPDYGFPAAITYKIEICKSGTDFEPSFSLASTGYGGKAAIKTFELNDAMDALGMSNPKTSYKVDVRLSAFVSDSVPVLKSNAVTMTLMPYSTLRTQVYFVGAIFDNGWNNNDLTMRIFADNDKNDMQYTYTGFVKADSKFKIIQNPGTWDIQWGAGAEGELTGTNGADIGGFAADGYYIISLDLENNKYKIEKYTETPAEYTQLSLIGDFNDWAGDLDLVQSTYDKHIWVNSSAVISKDGGLKIRANHDWGVSFGGSDKLWENKQGQFARFNGGDNVKVAAGTYFVKFNDITKHIILIAK